MSFGPKTIEEARGYRYGAWGGNPEGRTYEEGRCMESVYDNVYRMSYQCSWKIWEDGYCKQHHPKTIAAKHAEKKREQDEENERRMKRYALEGSAADLLKLAKACLEWIDAVPEGTVLPTMPGFDRDWADEIIAKAEGKSS